MQLELPDLSTSRKQVSPAFIGATHALTHTLAYTLTLANSGDVVAPSVILTDTLPVELTEVTGPECTHGTCDYHPATHAITWAGVLSPSMVLTLTYTGQISVSPKTSALILNTAQVDDGLNPPFTLTVVSAINPRRILLPLVQRGP